MGNLTGIDAKFLASLFENPWLIIVHILDILIVTWLIYKFIKSLAGTKIMSLVQGVILFVLVKFFAEWIGFTTISFLMNQVITYGVIAGVIIFEPEIRSGLERFGRTTQVFLQPQKMSSEEILINALVKSVAYMSPRKIGALIAIEQTQTLQEYISTGIPLDADISNQLLINIFIPNTPLHDGAVIISENKIAVSCAYLPLSESQNISKEFGTRHRAAIGLSEKSDAITVIVSEETGAVSVASKSHFLHDLSSEEFEDFLRKQLISENDQKKAWYKRFLGGKEE
ncbi:TIGR00159 family protein [Streptococcus urinalis FB127-CNA-2]|uniref:Diadenylate cyclase n=1 Tax=Streptococcus urinalis 2285-97 TaxID=764291 RepID=G5KGY2_9STRE|nr:diadenylate cyclase CdaA [Streptococcus urinalis]EHJ56447.1 TIGR00159 family protein [Streptococcus urinalis 2285-97]EKS22422.1 TIGR00159 family protein [Streptococcus urinalis FB127-CNA-2]VEF32235.1 disA bacterial checkpoint controller nucleotide-binding family protein [Streptococcus urinalis]